MSALTPRVDGALAYRRPRAPGGALKLDANEGALPPRALLRCLEALDPEALRRYPDVQPLEDALAARLGVAPERVIVTAGADEAIDRVCRAYLGPARSLLLPVPTFEMLDRYAALAGAAITRVPWGRDAFPVTGLLERITAATGVIAVVSPNNPTGGVAPFDEVRRLAAAAPHALVLYDRAYAEYADEDDLAPALTMPNVLVLRTLSKAWGLAGCRVGYAIGDEAVIGTLRAAGGPFPVAAPSVALALAQLADGEPGLRAHVACVRRERAALADVLRRLGLDPWPSQANFVLVECGAAAAAVKSGLERQGVLVRDFPQQQSLATALRITLPASTAGFTRLVAALERVVPAALEGRP